MQFPFRNPLAFPVGCAPGYDPTHIAASRLMRFSAVALGNGPSLTSIFKASPATIRLTPVASFGPIGPQVTFPSSAATGNEWAAVNETPASVTIGIIFSLSLNLTQVLFNNSSGNWGDGGDSAVYLNNATPTLYTGGNAVGTGVPLPQHNLYFFAVSISPVSPYTAYYVTTNLLTGQVSTFNTNFAAPPNATTQAKYGVGYYSAGNGGDHPISAVMYSVAFTPPATLLAWALDPWSFWYPKTNDLIHALLVKGAPPGVTAALAATEARDTAAFTVVDKNKIALSVTEARDTASVNVSNRNLSALSVTEARDAAAFAINNANKVQLAVTEAKDVALFNASNKILAALGATEARDTALFNATVRDLIALGATEARDVAAFAVANREHVALAATETPDTAHFVFADLARLAATETRDGASFNLSGAATVIVAATEARDTALVNATDRDLIVLAATEVRDVASIAASVVLHAQLAAAEVRDIAAFNILFKSLIVLEATETHDRASFIIRPEFGNPIKRGISLVGDRDEPMLTGEKSSLSL